VDVSVPLVEAAEEVFRAVPMAADQPALQGLRHDSGILEQTDVAAPEFVRVPWGAGHTVVDAVALEEGPAVIDAPAATVPEQFAASSCVAHAAVQPVSVVAIPAAQRVRHVLGEE